MSASAVDEETNSLSAIGPVISSASASTGIEKLSPSPIMSYSIVCVRATGSAVRRMPSGSK